jgi:GT2 family glycosyltransferase
VFGLPRRYAFGLEGLDNWADVPEEWGPPSPQVVEKIGRLIAQPPGSRDYVVGIVHYNKPEETKALVRSISGWTEQPRKVFIADNSAPHHDWSDVEGLTPPVEVVLIPENPGYGAAANRLAKLASELAPIMLLLTHELVLEPETASRLLDVMFSFPKAAVAAPALTYKSKPDRYFSLGGTLSRHAVTSHIGMGKKVRGGGENSSAPYEVQWADGACLMLRLDVFQALVGFDERYFLYVEEVDYCLRAREAGLSVILNPSVAVAQEPGEYPLSLKYRNHFLLRGKFPGLLRAWPPLWIRIMDAGRSILLRFQKTYNVDTRQRC